MITKKLIFKAVILGKREEKKNIEARTEKIRQAFLEKGFKIRNSGGRSQSFDPHLLVSERKYYSSGVVATAAENKTEEFRKIISAYRCEYGCVQRSGFDDAFIFKGARIIRFHLYFYFPKDKKRKQVMEERGKGFIGILAKKKFVIGPVKKNNFVWSVYFHKKISCPNLDKTRAEVKKLAGEYGAKKFGKKYSQPEFEIVKDEDYDREIR